MGAREVMKVAKSVLNFVIVLHLFLGLVNGAKNYTYVYDPVEVFSLQKLWEAWNTNTPDLTSNLAGWSSEQTRFCEYLDPNSNATEVPTWRGVQCSFYCNETLEIDPNCTVRNVYVVGITIANASIAGTLPLEIQNLSSLYTLELTGNPHLTGPLPETLQNIWLNILDVHDNGFTGEIPELEWLWNLLQLDLSGNQFSGGYPFKQLSWMTYLQELSIGGNLLTGKIPYDAYINKTQLEKLDISDNQFNGYLPNLNPMQKLRHLDVSGNKFEGELPDLRGFEALRYVNLGRNRFTGTANLTNFLDLTGTSIALVNLSQNQLTGDLPLWDASSLGSIQELYLDNNNLSGTLNISNLANLKLLKLHSEADKTTAKLGILSLSNNNIRNVIFDANDIEKISAVILLHGNPYCENYDANDDGQRCYCSQICFVSPAKANSRRIITIAAISSVLAVVLILVVVVGILLLKSRRYKRYLQLQFEQKFEEFDVKPTIFSYNELRIATRDFSEDMKLGQGGYGAVYKGVLPNGNVVAVKQLYVKAAQGMDEFLNEVVLITGMKHRNLVNLKGCCLREKQRLLVYEYVDNYDVDHVLFQGSKREELTWSIRLKICLGIARGLHYLHALAHPRVIHRDIKAGNVLLDSNMEPKIADFGLALLFPDEQSHIMTVHVAGTKGYLAPEYASLGQLSDKVDVFSFGVLCLEIISGRKNIDETAPLDQIYLSKWAWFLHEQDRLMELIDPKLQLVTDDEVRDVQRVINLCLLCIQNSAEKRPTMARIVSILQSDTESEVIVLGEGKLSSRRSLNSTRSNRSLDYVKTGLGSVSEEGGSSSCDHGTANRSSHARGRRGSSVGGADSFAVELSEITAR